MHQYDLVLLSPNFHHSSYFEPTNSKSEHQSHLLLHTVGSSSTIERYANIYTYLHHQYAYHISSPSRNNIVPLFSWCHSHMHQSEKCTNHLPHSVVWSIKVPWSLYDISRHLCSCASTSVLALTLISPPGAHFAHERSRCNKQLPFIGVWTFICISPDLCVLPFICMLHMYGTIVQRRLPSLSTGLNFLAELGFMAVCVWFTCSDVPGLARPLVMAQQWLWPGSGHGFSCTNFVIERCVNYYFLNLVWTHSVL